MEMDERFTAARPPPTHCTHQKAVDKDIVRIIPQLRRLTPSNRET